MQTVRAKFRCNSVEKFPNNGYQVNKVKNPFLYTAKFSVVYENSPENKMFFQATLSGSIEICSILPERNIFHQM